MFKIGWFKFSVTRKNRRNEQRSESDENDFKQGFNKNMFQLQESLQQFIQTSNQLPMMLFNFSFETLQK